MDVLKYYEERASEPKVFSMIKLSELIRIAKRNNLCDMRLFFSSHLKLPQYLPSAIITFKAQIHVGLCARFEGIHLGCCYDLSGKCSRLSS